MSENVSGLFKSLHQLSPGGMFQQWPQFSPLSIPTLCQMTPRLFIKCVLCPHLEANFDHVIIAWLRRTRWALQRLGALPARSHFCRNHEVILIQPVPWSSANETCSQSAPAISSRGISSWPSGMCGKTNQEQPRSSVHGLGSCRMIHELMSYN